MRGEPTTFWGKLERDKETGKVLSWHPLVDHCADVAACCEAILDTTLIAKRLARLGRLEELTQAQRARLCVIAALHDVGKFNRGFQNKARSGASLIRGHVREALGLFYDRTFVMAPAFYAAIQRDRIASWAGDRTGLHLLYAAICHHGKPYQLNCDVKDLWDPERPGDLFQGFDPIAGVKDLVERALQWFPAAVQPDAAPLPSSAEFQHAFSGLVMLADWLGSSKASDFFPYSESLDENRFDFAKERALEAVRRIGLDSRRARCTLAGRELRFDAVSEHPPRPHQRALMKIPLPPAGGLVILEAETGGGKTEAALGYFLRLFKEGYVDGLYFALPTRAAATQIHGRIREAMLRAFPTETPAAVLAVPGYLAVDDVSGKKLERFEVLWDDDDPNWDRAKGWAAEHPKRYFAASVLAGTIDQALFSSLMVGHAHMRATALLRHLLVVDEVHASDAYMTRILQTVLARHLAAGGHALLMSATLGARARSRLLAYDARLQRHIAIPSLEDAKDAPYPLITARPVGEQARPFPIEVRNDEIKLKPIRIETLPIMDDPKAIAERALDAAARGARVLVIRNTVAGCLAVQIALEALARERDQEALLWTCKGVVAPHHSRFAAEDRKSLDEGIEKRYGKDSETGGCVVVATQTVEQSLDIDADYLLTDLCPMDVLLQRLGRLFRHERERPNGFKEAAVLVTTPKERDLTALVAQNVERDRGYHGLGGRVYSDLRVVEATWRRLENPELVIETPTMNRDLVERATHDEVLADIVRDGGEAWARLESKLVGGELAEKNIASLNLVNWSEEFGEVNFGDAVERKVSSRLGGDDRLARFEESQHSPFGNTFDVLKIPGHMAKGIAEREFAASNVRSAEGLIEFEIGSCRFRYDRVGVRRVPSENP
jgi:CRISPR-associated endonuclease/helicase Cas3